MERKNTGWKILTLLLFIALLGTSGFITYDKVLKDKYFTKKDDKKEEKKETNTTTTTDNEKTADDLYAEYLKNLKENMSKTYNTIPILSGEELDKMDQNGETYNYGSNNICDTYSQEGYRVCAHLDNNKMLEIIFYENDGSVVKKNNIDSKIVSIYSSTTGNNGSINIYYVKEDGKLYYIETSALHENNIEIKTIDNLKNIINIIPSGFGFKSGWQEPIFVDIEGNLFRTEDGKAIELNVE